MRPKKRAKLIKYALAVAFAAAGVIIMLIRTPITAEMSSAERWRVLCDAFFVPGVLMLSAGALVWVSNFGVFNGISYAFRYVVRMFLPHSGKRDESYGNYVRARAERGGIRGYGFILIVGAVFFGVSLVFLALFYLN